MPTTTPTAEARSFSSFRISSLLCECPIADSRISKTAPTSHGAKSKTYTRRPQCQAILSYGIIIRFPLPSCIRTHPTRVDESFSFACPNLSRSSHVATPASAFGVVGTFDEVACFSAFLGAIPSLTWWASHTVDAIWFQSFLDLRCRKWLRSFCAGESDER